MKIKFRVYKKKIKKKIFFFYIITVIILERNIFQVYISSQFLFSRQCVHRRMNIKNCVDFNTHTTLEISLQYQYIHVYIHVYTTIHIHIYTINSNVYLPNAKLQINSLFSSSLSIPFTKFQFYFIFSLLFYSINIIFPSINKYI